MCSPWRRRPPFVFAHHHYTSTTRLPRTLNSLTQSPPGTVLGIELTRNRPSGTHALPAKSLRVRVRGFRGRMRPRSVAGRR